MSREPQRISLLTPLADVLALVSRRVSPVVAQRCAAHDAYGYVLAEDVCAVATCPEQSCAARDGFALAASQTLDASAYAPATLTSACEIAAGTALPPHCDAVAPSHAIQQCGEGWQALTPIAPDYGVVTAGADARADEVLRRACTVVRAVDLAVFIAAGIAEVCIRAPRILVIVADARRDDRIIMAIIAMLRHAVLQEHGALAQPCSAEVASELARTDVDAILLVGGTGESVNDRSAMTLAQAGELAVHGVALSPGETAGFGFVGERPVLLIPGQLDAALATWLLLGQPLMTALTARTDKAAAMPATLSRKVSSAVGLTGVTPVRLDDDDATPLASGHLSWAALAQADGFLVVPAGSEGFVAGATAPVRRLP